MRKPRGSVYYDKARGRVRYRCEFLHGSGKVKLDSSITLKSDSKRAIKEAMEKAQAEIDQWVESILNPKPKSYTFAEWVEFANTHIIRVQPSTLSKRMWSIQRHWMPVFKDTPVDQISPIEIQKVVQSMRNLAASTVSTRVGAFAVYISAASDYLDFRDPMNAVRIETPKKKSKERWLTPEEIQALPLDGPILFGLFMGLRRGEIAALMGDAISDEWLHVKRTIQVETKDKGVANKLVERTKTEAGDRKIPLPNIIKTWLKDNKKDGLLFRDKSVQAMAKFEANRLPEGVTMHTLRHTFATYLGLSGADSFSQNYLFGHAQKGTLDTVYRKVVWSTLPVYMDRVEKMMLGHLPMVEDDEPQV